MSDKLFANNWFILFKFDKPKNNAYVDTYIFTNLYLLMRQIKRRKFLSLGYVRYITNCFTFIINIKFQKKKTTKIATHFLTS